MDRVCDEAIAVSPKIIAVDDNNNLLGVLKLILEMDGYQVRVSLNAKDIREMIDTDKPDMILLDIHMKGIDGCEICKELKAGMITCDIPVVMISGNDNLEEAAQLCGADGYLSKPFDAGDLVTTINTLLTEKSHHHEPLW